MASEPSSISRMLWKDFLFCPVCKIHATVSQSVQWSPICYPASTVKIYRLKSVLSLLSFILKLETAPLTPEKATYCLYVVLFYIACCLCLFPMYLLQVASHCFFSWQAADLFFKSCFSLLLFITTWLCVLLFCVFLWAAYFSLLVCIKTCFCLHIIVKVTGYLDPVSL